MYLKSIEVHGFKSFANKILFEFDKGITGIVGPNGSGKSNVADAVRWVLGEQRIKQLRGASMQDVIFSGTEMRKPVGSAYVAITLDNSDHSLAIDYDEVTVARRIYRSGESEYLINGSVCRLKDVNELFYDTGIGKEGYSIIGQGQIDKILSSKPEDRRELFDEAAGIVKFKRRKNEALRKLENERQNLVRVTDILSELEKQVGPLEKQAEKAKIYLKKKEELKHLDVNVFLLENQKLTESIDDLNKKGEIANRDLENAKTESEKLKSEYERLEQEITSLDELIEQKRSMLSDTNIMREKLEGQISLLKEQINSALSNKEHMNSRLASIDENIKEKLEEKEGYNQKKSVIDEQLAEAVRVRNEAKDALTECQAKIETINFNIEKSKNYIIELLNERATIKASLSRIDSVSEQKEIRLAELNAKLLRAKTVESEHNQVIEKLQSEFDKASKLIEELNTKQKDLDQKSNNFHDELGKLDSKLRETQVKFHQEKSKLEAITNLTERYEGYNNSTRKVMELKNTNKGLLGVVADIIKVDKKYEIAIETALGGNIQNVVTEDEDTAKKMIKYLKENKLGRVTFLPLPALENPEKFKNPDSLKEPGAIGLADSIVNTDPKFAPVAKAMLGRILVVDTVDNALKIARKYQYGIRMVTLEGELLVPGGAISGGSFKNNSNLLSRRREMDELEANVKKLQGEIDKAQADIEECKERRNKLRLEIATNREEIQKATIAQNTARINVIQAKEKKGDSAKDFESLRLEEESIREEIAANQKEKSSIQKALVDSTENEEKENSKVTTNQAELEKLRSEETDKLNVVSEKDVVCEKLMQQQGFEQVNIDRIDGEIERFDSEKKEILDNINLSAEDIEFKQNSIKEIENTIETSFAVQSDAKKELDESIVKKEELNNKKKSYFDTREELANKVSNLDKEVYRLNSQRERAEESLASHTSYMWQEYEVTLSDAKAMRDNELTDLPGMKKLVASIKDDIKKLGDVNVNAIEDYKSVSERYEFLSKQHDDLVKAEKDLVGIIDNLDTSMRKQFESQFARIGSEFDAVFKELFGGGKATLELMEDEDILEAGIRIIAQPPGKKLQNMMQLSGGEKALTAISLLFAIQNLKPSPFCLLDEIEAALDESNVDRFAKYLNKMTKNTQFIVITHRRGTMDKANQLYGITMQEKGVSALVSVNLIDKDIK